MKKYIAMLAVIAGLVVPATAVAAPVKICLPEGAGTTVKTPGAGGECAAKQTTAYAVASKSAAEAVEHLEYSAAATLYAKQPTILVLEGTNFALSAVGKAHGGNLLIGEEPLGSAPTEASLGKMNIVVGKGNAASSAFGVVAGEEDSAESLANAVFGIRNKVGNHNDLGASVFGGKGNNVGTSEETKYAAAVGGESNNVNNYAAVAVGGDQNTIKHEGRYAVTSGGKSNTVEGPYSVSDAGLENTIPATGENADAVGGEKDSTEAKNSVTVGGFEAKTDKLVEGSINEAFDGVAIGGNGDQAEGQTTVVAGGLGNKTTQAEASVFGGASNTASNSGASVFGGAGNKAKTSNSTVVGGLEGTAEGSYSLVAGGDKNAATALWSAVFGGAENKAAFEGSSCLCGSKKATKEAYEPLVAK